MQDARFEDGGEAPLRLRALDQDDLTVLSGLAQDAVLTAADMTLRKRDRRFALLLNRFRWEDLDHARARGRQVERVRAVMVVEDVMSVQAQGITPGNADTVLSLLSLNFEPGADGTGRLVLTFAGDGAIALEVEALEVLLRDVTRPYVAPSGHVPEHGE